MGRACYSYGGTEPYKKSSRCSGRRKKTKGAGRNWDGKMVWWKMPGSWGREIGGMLQGIGTAGRSFWRRPWLKGGCCANDDDDDDDDDDDSIGWSSGVRILCADVSEHSGCSIFIGRLDKKTNYEDGRNSVPKRRHIKFRRLGITRKKEYSIHNTAKVWNPEYLCSLKKSCVR